MAPLPSFMKRAISALVCSALVLPAHADRTARVVWPEPQPAPPSTPNFRAPSATSCDRPVEAHVIPGQRQQQQTGALERAAPDVWVTGSARARVAEPAARDEAVAEAKLAAPRPALPIAGSPQPAQQAVPQLAETVTAGVVDDNANFGDYLAFRARTQVPHRERDVSQRYLLEVKDASGHGVPDAEVAVNSASGAAMWARTDTAGHVWLHPDAFDTAHAGSYQVTVRKAGQQTSTTLRRGQKSAVELRLDVAPASQQARLDLVFMVDATGSMGDEIDKLKSSLQAMVSQISQLPSRPDICLGLVAYRDRVDEFLVKSHDLSNDVPGFQRALNSLVASGGGDYPEDMNAALKETVQNISWRNEGATRLVVLLADAPPHLDYGGTQYDESMMSALGKGIKVFSVGASGLDKQGEYIQRQIAQYTGGRFVFLTYKDARKPGSGPGRETVHDVQNYSVETLDKLVVRLVSQELAALH